MKVQLLKHSNLFIGCLLAFLLSSTILKAENGYRLWLRYDPVSNPRLLQQYRTDIKEYIFAGNSQVDQVAELELTNGLKGLLGRALKPAASIAHDGCVVIGKPQSSVLIAGLKLNSRLSKLGTDGYLVLTAKINHKKCIVITANEDIGLLYGVFALLKTIQTHQAVDNLFISDSPKIDVRVLNHWDNLDGSIERGYAGASIWNWQTLPGKTDQRYIDYARANASIGINGTVLNNVNADPRMLSKAYILKAKALADVFRPYGIKIYLSAVFSAPIQVGRLKTADPLDPAVKNWWKAKVDEIYSYIPDFGGFCVKANSEGQPGPQDYGRTHTDGANMLARVLAPHQGIVMWRAFVYNNKGNEDRTKQAYDEFKPLDGKFDNNVLLQVKNGPIDFQPRETFHPLYGAMPKTPLMAEFQITQEYLGFSTHLVYLGTLYEEVLKSDTYAKGKGSVIAKIIQNSSGKQKLTGMAGVANIGADSNWCRHPFAQANWYVFGRMSWNPELSAEEAAEDWIRLTFNSDNRLVEPVKKMMVTSRETAVNYMAPLGLTMLMDQSHFRPAPWRRDKPQPIGTKESFHQADSMGIGYNRTETGSNAVSQYKLEVRKMLANFNTCPEGLLLWFHHVKWTQRTRSGRSLWNELCYRYYSGVDSVKAMQRTWNAMQPFVDAERFGTVKSLLLKQEKEAEIWRDACVLYFQTYSGLAVPEELGTPGQQLDFYKNLKYPSSNNQ